MTIFIGSTNRDSDTFVIPSLLQTIYAFTHPPFKLFEKRLLNDPTTPLKHPSLLTPSTTPASHKNFCCTPDSSKKIMRSCPAVQHHPTQPTHHNNLPQSPFVLLPRFGCEKSMKILYFPRSQYEESMSLFKMSGSISIFKASIS